MIDKEIIPRLNKIVGEELKYFQLCDAIGIPRLGTRQKNNQLKQLQMYCDFETLYNPTRYIIKEVYENEVKAFAKINGNNKYQMMFDAVVYQAFLENGGKPIYVSTIDILKLFSEVNENFVYACDFENMKKLGNDFIYFAEMSKIAKKMLGRWANDRLENMANRRFIIRERAYRLYSKHKGKYGVFKIKHDIDVDSELGKKCLSIMAQAIEEIVPERYIFTNEKGENKPLWMPIQIYENLQNRIHELVEEKFNGVYCDLKEISVLKPPEDKWIHQKLTEIYKQLPALYNINSESCRKILNSASNNFDKFTGVERKRFVEINIKMNPDFSLKDELKNFNK